MLTRHIWHGYECGCGSPFPPHADHQEEPCDEQTNSGTLCRLLGHGRHLYPFVRHGSDLPRPRRGPGARFRENTFSSGGSLPYWCDWGKGSRSHRPCRREMGIARQRRRGILPRSAGTLGIRRKAVGCRFYDCALVSRISKAAFMSSGHTTVASLRTSAKRPPSAGGMNLPQLTPSE